MKGEEVEGSGPLPLLGIDFIYPHHHNSLPYSERHTNTIDKESFKNN